jgi:hypothetical protein
LTPQRGTKSTKWFHEKPLCFLCLFVAFALLLLVCSGQSLDPKSPVAAMRPIKQLPSQTPSTAEITTRTLDWRGRIDMKPLTGSIEPLPAESGGPQIQPHLLAYGAGYLYRGGTTYHFTAEYIPDYVIRNEKKTKFCIWRQQYKYSPEMQAAWEAILASEASTKYVLYINHTNFGGEIEGLHSQQTLFHSFVAEGAQDCGEQPTTRF